MAIFSFNKSNGYPFLIIVSLTKFKFSLWNLSCGKSIGLSVNE